jgi:hypothetical protein
MKQVAILLPTHQLNWLNRKARLSSRAAVVRQVISDAIKRDPSNDS